MVVVQRHGQRTSTLLTSNYAVITILVLLNILCFQLGRNYESSSSGYQPSSSFRNLGEILGDPLRPQPGAAVALPSIRVTDDAAEHRRIYGGKGDAKHLGGWTEIDIQGISPFLWKHMLTKFGIHSILDVGCGRGISTTWFIMNGMDALCVEGSHDAYLNSVLPDKDKQMVEHDFSRGPYWPAKTYDAVWCVEFLEHVSPKRNRELFIVTSMAHYIIFFCYYLRFRLVATFTIIICQSFEKLPSSLSPIR
jgi:SAM-dependent methyltransferase